MVRAAALLTVANTLAYGDTVAAEPKERVALTILGIEFSRPSLPAILALRADGTWNADQRTQWLEVDTDIGTRRYEVGLGGRTGRDCPLGESAPFLFEGELWVSGRDASLRPALCKILKGFATLVVSSTWPVDSSLERPFLLDAVDEHILSSLLESVRNLQVSDEVPPDPDPPSPTVVTLPKTSLVVELPAGFRWQVAPARARDFDVILRDVPVLPELQIAIRRHRENDMDCEELHRRLERKGWQPLDDTRARQIGRAAGFEGGLHKPIEGFESRAFCMPIGGSLLDVRFASRPPTDRHLDTLLTRLANASWAVSDPMNRLDPFSIPPPATRALETRGVAVIGLSHGGSLGTSTVEADGSPLFGALELALRLSELNGLDLGGTVALGLDGSGETHAARVDVGVRLALPRRTSLSVSLGLLARRDGQIDNRALYTSFALRSEASDALSWSLEVLPLLLASRQPAITGAPFELVWQGRLRSGLIFGAELRSVSQPRVPTASWPSDGVSFGLRLGFGSLSR
jgi:hypothetical protein